MRLPRLGEDDQAACFLVNPVDNENAAISFVQQLEEVRNGCIKTVGQYKQTGRLVENEDFVVLEHHLHGGPMRRKYVSQRTLLRNNVAGNAKENKNAPKIDSH